VLTAQAKGEDIAWTRVVRRLRAKSPAAPLPLVYGVRDGDMVWRAQSPCGIAAGPYDMILVDRGVVTGLTGQVSAPAKAFDAPRQVVGVLMPIKQLGGDRAEVLKRFPAASPRRWC
jgi:surfeit locus 1 family protein